MELVKWTTDDAAETEVANDDVLDLPIIWTKGIGRTRNYGMGTTRRNISVQNAVAPVIINALVLLPTELMD